MLSWALGATTLSGVMGVSAATSPAHAVAACTSFTGVGANTLAGATPIQGCFSGISGNQGFNAYWEFSLAAPVTRTISATVQGATDYGSVGNPVFFGSFYGSLDLYTVNSDSSFTNVAFTPFSGAPGSSSTSATLAPFSFLANQAYILGIEGSPLDPPFDISFDAPLNGAPPVPEPTTLSLLGAAAVALSFVRGRRRRRD